MAQQATPTPGKTLPLPVCCPSGRRWRATAVISMRPNPTHHMSCAVHRHKHAAIAATPVDAADAPGFWDALGCTCFAY